MLFAKYVYFVVYEFHGGKANAEIKAKKIKSIEDIQEIERLLKNKTNIDNICIVDYKVMRSTWR